MTYSFTSISKKILREPQSIKHKGRIYDNKPFQYEINIIPPTFQFNSSSASTKKEEITIHIYNFKSTFNTCHRICDKLVSTFQRGHMDNLPSTIYIHLIN